MSCSRHCSNYNVGCNFSFINSNNIEVKIYQLQVNMKMFTISTSDFTAVLWKLEKPEIQLIFRESSIILSSLKLYEVGSGGGGGGVIFTVDYMVHKITRVILLSVGALRQNTVKTLLTDTSRKRTLLLSVHQRTVLDISLLKLYNFNLL